MGALSAAQFHEQNVCDDSRGNNDRRCQCSDLGFAVHQERHGREGTGYQCRQNYVRPPMASFSIHVPPMSLSIHTRNLTGTLLGWRVFKTTLGDGGSPLTGGCSGTQ